MKSSQGQKEPCQQGHPSARSPSHATERRNCPSPPTLFPKHATERTSPGTFLYNTIGKNFFNRNKRLDKSVKIFGYVSFLIHYDFFVASQRHKIQTCSGNKPERDYSSLSDHPPELTLRSLSKLTCNWPSNTFRSPPTLSAPVTLPMVEKGNVSTLPLAPPPVTLTL